MEEEYKDGSYGCFLFGLNKPPPDLTYHLADMGTRGYVGKFEDGNANQQYSWSGHSRENYIICILCFKNKLKIGMKQVQT